MPTPSDAHRTTVAAYSPQRDPSSSSTSTVICMNTDSGSRVSRKAPLVLTLRNAPAPQIPPPADTRTRARHGQRHTDARTTRTPTTPAMLHRAFSGRGGGGPWGGRRQAIDGPVFKRLHGDI